MTAISPRSVLILALVTLTAFTAVVQAAPSTPAHLEEQAQRETAVHASGDASKSITVAPDTKYPISPAEQNPNLFPETNLMTSLRRRGRCYCRKKRFIDRYWGAHIVLKIKILQIHHNWKLTLLQKKPENVIYEYLMQGSRTYKNKQEIKKNQLFWVQAWGNSDYCGVVLNRHRNYLLMLDSKRKISRASHWNRDMYLMSSCDQQYDFGDLEQWQLDWINQF